MERNQLVFYYLMFSVGFIAGRVISFGKEIVWAVFDLITITMHIVLLCFLAYVIIVSLEMAKRKYFKK